MNVTCGSARPSGSCNTARARRPPLDPINFEDDADIIEPVLKQSRKDQSCPEVAEGDEPGGSEFDVINDLNKARLQGERGRAQDKEKKIGFWFK